MPTLLYGLTLADDPRLPLAREDVRLLDAGDLTAIVRTVAAKPAATLDSVRAHDAVLQRVVDAGATVAAVRFGQVFADDAACTDGVRERAGRVRALLEAHRGCIEMRVVLPEPLAAPSTPASGKGPGTSYLESLRVGGAMAGQALGPALRSMVRAERVEALTPRNGVARGVTFAHLVHRDAVAAYRDAIAALPSLAGARVLGPLALYSFAEPSGE